MTPKQHQCNLKKFWGRYQPYELHPEDASYLANSADSCCLNLSYEHMQKTYADEEGNLKSAFAKDKYKEPATPCNDRY